MYVLIFVDGVLVSTMINTLLKTLCSNGVIEHLELKLQNCARKVKAVNFGLNNAKGSALVDLTISTWEGKCNFLVVPLDDFDIILGNKFMLEARASISSYLFRITISARIPPDFVSREVKILETGNSNGPKIMYALQLKSELITGLFPLVMQLIGLR